MLMTGLGRFARLESILSLGKDPPPTRLKRRYHRIFGSPIPIRWNLESTFDVFY